MQYREFLPHPVLRNIVECYWSVQGNSNCSWAIYPDACMDIIYDLSDESCEIVGNMFTPIEAQFYGCTDNLGIRFRAGGIGHIVRVPLFEFNDLSFSLGDVYKMAPRAEQLRPLGMQKRVDMLDRWLLKHIRPLSKPEPWEYCLDKIVSRDGNINVYDLSREVGISQKQMERKFVEKVGPTPKQFAQLLKFRKLREYLERKQEQSLMSTAFDFDFVDHAHLTKFFKKFALITPSEFVQKVQKD